MTNLARIITGTFLAVFDGALDTVPFQFLISGLAELAMSWGRADQTGIVTNWLANVVFENVFVVLTVDTVVIGIAFITVIDVTENTFSVS